MKIKQDITIELHYLYTVTVDIEADRYGDVDDYEDAKDTAFELACVEHEEATNLHYKRSDTFNAFDFNDELI